MHQPPLDQSRETLLMLNNGTRTRHEAAAAMNVDLRRFKRRCSEDGITEWRKPNGLKVRVQGQDGNLTIVLRHGISGNIVIKVGIKSTWENVSRLMGDSYARVAGSYQLRYHQAAHLPVLMVMTDGDYDMCERFFRGMTQH